MAHVNEKHGGTRKAETRERAGGTTAGLHRPLKTIRTAANCPLCGEPLEVGEKGYKMYDGMTHVACMRRRARLLTTPNAASRSGLSISQFRRLAQKYGVEPESTYPSPKRGGAPGLLWAPEDVRRLARKVTPEHARRSAAAEIGVETKREKLLDAEVVNRNETVDFMN